MHWNSMFSSPLVAEPNVMMVCGSFRRKKERKKPPSPQNVEHGPSGREREKKEEETRGT